MQIVLDQRRGGRQGAAVHVVDEQHQPQQRHHEKRPCIARRTALARGSRHAAGGAAELSSRSPRVAVEHALQRLEMQFRAIAAADLAARRELRDGRAHHLVRDQPQRPPGRKREHLSLARPLEKIQPLEGPRDGFPDHQRAVIAHHQHRFRRRATRARRSPSEHRRRGRCSPRRRRYPRRNRARSAPPSPGADSRAWTAPWHTACACAERSALAPPGGARAHGYRARCPRRDPGRSDIRPLKSITMKSLALTSDQCRPKGASRNRSAWPGSDQGQVIVDPLVQAEVIAPAGSRRPGRRAPGARFGTDLRLALMAFDSIISALGQRETRTCSQARLDPRLAFMPRSHRMCTIAR